jgi:hypothetical protein
LTVLGLLLSVAAPSFAVLSCDFEVGVGHDGQAIGIGIAGLAFSTLGGGGVYFGDINTANYSATSDNGKAFRSGEYFLSGDVWAFIYDQSDKAKVTFTTGTASHFTVGYTSQNPFTLEAYDSADQLLESVTGEANVKSQGGTGLLYLTVSKPSIAYVILHDQGGFWMVDNLSTDAPVPEPSALLALLGGLGSIGGMMFRRRSSRSPGSLR